MRSDAAGNYYTKLTWLKSNYAKETTFGQEKVTFTDGGTLWGWIEELTANESLNYGAIMGRVDGKIHIRNYPSVNQKDRIKENYFGYIYEVQGVYTGSNEIVCIVSRVENEPT